MPRREEYLKNPEFHKAAFKQYYHDNLGKESERKRRYYEDNTEKVRERNERYRLSAAGRTKAVKHQVKMKMEVLFHYGGDPPRCACCGEMLLEFLSIDHIFGGGYQHRKKLGLNGSSLYHWLIKNKFPEGYRVLCFNCNMSLGFYGYCPHEEVLSCV